MKLKDSFITCKTGDNTFLISTDTNEFSGMVKGNKTVAFIFELLSKETDEDSVVNAMLQKFDAPEEKIRGDVSKVLGELRKVGALEE